MTSYVLVHGGAQGAWCWNRLVPRLRAFPGVESVVAVDLPGHGANHLADHRHVDLIDSANTIVDAIVAHNLTDVVLVGHAMGAIAVIEAAPLLADRLTHIVLLAGMVPREGESADQTLGTRFDNEPSQWEQIAATPEREVYGADMDDATADWFFAHLTPPEDRPYQPPRAPVHVSRLPADVPVTYIVQTLDQSFSPDLQRRMLAKLRTPEVLEIDAGRNSMITQPDRLAELLLRYR
ncbi:MAG TPA: alpha/beta fold hydrolase [Acidimicrobiales bacterium]|nr:alpha/beta fold hydrolase [Acidimicrobiales bacterium]